MTFGGEAPLLVAADGLNVVPVKRNKTFIAIAETYDFIVTIPKRLSRAIMIFPRTAILGNYEYQADFGWVNELTKGGANEPVDYRGETT